MFRIILKWSSVLILSIAMCELSLIVWGFKAVYTIQIKGLPEDRSALRFELDSKRLVKLVPWPEHHINRAGYRDVEFQKKIEGTKRVVVIGDSFPMGLAVSADKTFPKVLETLLNKKAGPKIEVYNLGIQGYGPDQELVVLRDDLLTLQPDLVIWSLFPGNDFADVVKNNLYTVDQSAQLQLSNDNYVDKYLPKFRLQLALNIFRYGHFLPPKIEEEIDAAFFQDQVHILTDPEEPFRKIGVPIVSAALSEGVSILRERTIPLFAVVLPSFEIIQDDSRLKRELVLPEQYQTNENLVSEILADLKVPHLNVTDEFVTRRNEQLYVRSDRHFSEHGHQVVAEMIAPQVASHLHIN